MIVRAAGRPPNASGLGRTCHHPLMARPRKPKVDKSWALAPEVALIARSEGLEGHARAVEVRTDERGGRS
jgi:hypothetical protein